MPLAEIHSPVSVGHEVIGAGLNNTPARPLTIALVSTQRGFRGGEMQLRLLAHGFREAGQRCLVYARQDGPLADRLTADGFAVFTFRGSGHSPRSLWRIRRRLRRDRPDVLYLNDSHALSGAGLAELGLGIGLRVAARRVAFPIHSSWKYRHFCNVVLANCLATVEVCAAGNIPRSQMRVVHDGIKPLPPPTVSRAECRRRLGLRESDRVALTVAALTAEKGHAVLIDALPAIITQHANLQWLCAGDGPLRLALEQDVQRRGLVEQVQFLGQRADIADLMAAADLLVLPSLCEGLCNAAIEAQFVGLPLVTTRTGGLADVVGIGEPAGPTAWVVEPGDAAQFAAAVNQALAQPAESRRLAERGRERAARMFTVERMIAETLATFRALLAQQR